MSPKALIILHPGFEEMEAVAPADLLVRAGIAVTLAASGDSLQVQGRSGLTLLAACTLRELTEESLYDVVILPGGPGIQNLRKDPRLCRLLQGHHEAGRWIAAICAAPLLLLDAGLLPAGIRYTAHPATLAELPAPQAGRVVRDGRILTSQGAGTATEFAFAIIEALLSDDRAREIAASICWTRDE